MYMLIFGLMLLSVFPQAASGQPPAPPNQEQQAPAEVQPKQAEPAQQTASAPAEKVGNDICLGCHDIAASFSHNPHAKQECEACHGPGSVHVDSGGDDKSVSFKTHAPNWASGRCLSCHGRDSEISDFHKGAHGKGGLSCVSCHEIHPEKVRFALLKTEQEVNLCVDCHQAARADFLKPFHHPVLEQAMKCSDCHSPHAEDLRPMMRSAAGAPQRCVSCHSDKRGPFVFEHPPVRINNCDYCHQAHGSVNARMLNRSRVHLLCLECHSMGAGVLTAQPPSFHDIRSARYQACTVCHRQIHGSNADPVFFR
jgi:DmsE family decaheme c-type cytochrome